MDKSKLINQISNESDLSKLVEDLLNKMKVPGVKRVGTNLVEAVESTPLKSRKTYFIITLSELNGKVPAILDRVNRIIGGYDQIFIVTSNRKLSNYFKDWIQSEKKSIQFEYWDQSTLIKNLDDHFEEFWKHKDTFLRPYEIEFIEDIDKENQMKNLLKLDDKYDKLFDIFIEPKLYLVNEDVKEGERPNKSRIYSEKLVKSGNFVISGEAGTGKSTLLKRIGKELVESNNDKAQKNVPIYIKTNQLLESGFDVKKVADKNLLDTYEEFDLDRIYNDYQIVLLFDSIDEFERENQVSILDQVQKLEREEGIRFILGTRNYDYLLDEQDIDDHSRVNLNNFDLHQVKLFLDNFFKFDLSKSDKLWESLQENNVLEKIPVTPLTISLISILFEEKQYEIPATITDIYDNFNLFLLGRTTVKTNLEFLDITIKERILSMYALEIIEDENNKRKDVETFCSDIRKFFKEKNITISDEVFPELVKSLTEGTGVLYKDENGKIDFKHDYFMEYYASVEIFNQKRGLESKLIENFTKYSWQNTAIFYSGRTKDMPQFLTDLLDRVGKYTELKDELIAASGLGYILQALWLTDSNIRKDGVIKALELIVQADQDVKRMSSSVRVFKNIREIDLAMINFFWFFNHFNSKTLEDTLKLAFTDLIAQLDEAEKFKNNTDILNLQFKLFCIGATLKSDRFEQNNLLDTLFERNNILSNPLFVLLFDNGLELIEPTNKVELKEKYKVANRIKKMSGGIKFYLDNSVDVTQYTSLESIKPIKKFEIYTEGKTDAVFMSHAFDRLTNKKDPYWNVQACDDKDDKKGGGTHKLARLLQTIASEIDSGKRASNKTSIGIFDNDSAGYQEFNGLKEEDFKLVRGNIVKKHVKHDVYAVLLPIPDNLSQFVQEKQDFKFFEIEHYFPKEYLAEKKMITELKLNDVYEITGDKTKFAEVVKAETSPELFLHFESLFMLLDELSGNQIEYI